MRIKLLRWMNRHHKATIAIIAFLGFAFHLIGEVDAHLHAGKPLPWSEFLVLARIAGWKWFGAALAGWGIDELFTKQQEDAGEIQSGPASE